MDLYTLSSTNILRKYASFLDAPATMLFGALGNTGAQGKQEKGKEAPRRLLFVNDILQWKKAQNAMVTGHQSQMRWFRWGWITVGRYMVVNDLKRERIS